MTVTAGSFVEVFASQIDALRSRGFLTGKQIFELHDTTGLPFQVIRDRCNETGAMFDESGIRSELRARFGWSEEKIEAALRE